MRIRIGARVRVRVRVRVRGLGAVIALISCTVWVRMTHLTAGCHLFVATCWAAVIVHVRRLQKGSAGWGGGMRFRCADQGVCRVGWVASGACV